MGAPRAPKPEALRPYYCSTYLGGRRLNGDNG